MEIGRSGILFVISAPSGTGKSTVARRLVGGLPELGFSISYTTRKAREEERDGIQYHFVSEGRFRGMAEEGAFLEWATVFGNCYGTGLDATRKVLAQGRDLLLDIDVQGAGQVRSSNVEHVSIMIFPPSYKQLEQRLRRRGTETEQDLSGRLAKARSEVASYEDFDYLVINDDLDRAVSELVSIVRAERRRVSRCAAEVAQIVSTFPA